METALVFFIFCALNSEQAVCFPPTIAKLFTKNRGHVTVNSIFLVPNVVVVVFM